MHPALYLHFSVKDIIFVINKQMRNLNDSNFTDEVTVEINLSNAVLIHSITGLPLYYIATNSNLLNIHSVEISSATLEA